MSTACYIGNYRGYIYCHWDDSPKNNGEILKKYYKDSKKVDELISLGNISVLGKELYPDPNKTHNFDNPQEGVTVAYHRDRGYEWRHTKPRMSVEPNSSMIGYIYYFDEEKQIWRYQDLREETPKWRRLKDESFDNIIDKNLNELAIYIVDYIVNNNKLLGNISEIIDKLLKQHIEDKSIREYLESRLIVTSENKFREYKDLG